MTGPHDAAIERGFVLLQAAAAEAALGDLQNADLRAEELSWMDGAALALLARVAADFVSRLSLTTGAEWTSSTDESGELVNIEDRSPADRVFTRRILAAWSAKDVDTFDALLAAAGTDPDRRRAHLRDLFRLTADEAHMHGQRAASPCVVVMQMTKSIRKEGQQVADWNTRP
jgi:hypothetical protein